ncbi:hypothetical protein AGDE_13526 [Angomonas deanei]|nr:hypothetical protein AGDE_13526 [Angomonas deanei]|eukprot:EPY22166.1 hypothetical protein AGDE_13526 [Angomonas deanei]
MFAREEAQRFLDAEVPKSNINTWMEEGANAIALSQLLGFFSVIPDSSLASLINNKLVRLAEDSQADPKTRLFAVMSLLKARPDENYERAFTTVEDLLRQLTSQMPSGGTSEESWNVVELCAKTLQRCGRRTPASVNERLAQVVQTMLKTVSDEEAPRLQGALLRVYAWMVRAELPDCTLVLDILVERTGQFKASNYAILLESCCQQHIALPLPLELLQRLLRTSLQYSNYASGRDTGVILSSAARLISKCETTMTKHDIGELYNLFYAVLEEYRFHISQFLDASSSHFINNAADVTSMVFSYELGGVVRYKDLFALYANYVRQNLMLFEAEQLAMAAGILRRSGHLTLDLSKLLSDRVEVVLGELRVSELSHVCATFADVLEPPQWLNEAQVLVQRALTSDVHLSAYNKLLLNICYPEECPVTPQDFKELSMHNAVDLCTFSTKTHDAALIGHIAEKLTSADVRLSPDAVRFLLMSGNPAVQTAVNGYLYRSFTNPEWNVDTLLYAQLIRQQSGPTHDPAKALAVALKTSVAPDQFVSLAETLVQLFSESDGPINSFVVKGGKDLVENTRTRLRVLIRYLTVVRTFPKLRPDEQWLQQLTNIAVHYIKHVPPAHMEELLISLHSTYGDVGRTPGLQQILSDIFESKRCFPDTTPDEQTARLVVLLVYLQKGMTLPLLNTQSGIVTRVMGNAHAYSSDVRQTVEKMPIPEAVPSLTVGRFTLRAKPAAAEEDPEHEALDLSQDPFEEQEPEVPAEPEAPTPVADVPEVKQTPIEPTPVEEQPPVVEEETVPTPPVEEPEKPKEEAEEPKKPSYYTKLFHRSIGKLQDLSSQEEPAIPQQAQEPLPQPRRTNLAPVTPAAPQFNLNEPAQPQKTSFFSLFDTKPAQPAPSAPAPAPAEPRFEFNPNVQQSSTPTSFSSLFDQAAPVVPPVQYAPPPPQPQPVTPPQQQSTLRPPSNNIFYDPVSRQTMGRPVMSRRHTITRVPGVRTAESTLESDMDKIYNSEATKADAESAGYVVKATDGDAESSFLQKLGLEKVTGYDINEDDGNGNPREWQEMTQRVAHLSRNSKPKVRTRAQQSLSDWLNTPDSTLDRKKIALKKTAPKRKPAKKVEPKKVDGRKKTVKPKAAAAKAKTVRGKKAPAKGKASPAKAAKTPARQTKKAAAAPKATKKVKATPAKATRTPKKAPARTPAKAPSKAKPKNAKKAIKAAAAKSAATKKNARGKKK